MAKVLGLVSFRVYPTHMGGQKGVALFYEYLQRHVSVLLAGSMDNVPTERVQMQRMLFPNKRIYRNLFKQASLRQLVISEKIDVIIAEHSYTGWLAYWLHQKTGRPFIIHSHNIESRRFQKMKKWWWRGYRSYEGWIHRKAQHSFFISEEDRDFALKHFKVLPERASVITYGIESKPAGRDKKSLRKQLALEPDQTLLLFNGTLDYEPNYEAVLTLIHEIEPLLRQKLSNFMIIITGNRAPRDLAEKMMAAPHLLYLGYVEDVNLFYQAADLFINPVANDSGVKTKLIEAIANNCTAVSTRAGASGITRELCGNKLVETDDKNWNQFTEAIRATLQNDTGDTPPAFYAHYDWNHITSKAAQVIDQLSQKEGRS